MQKLTYNINNGRTMELVQRQHDGTALIITRDEHGEDEANIRDSEAFISAGDMVMLIDFYRYIKRNDIQHDFINPGGKNHA